MQRAFAGADFSATYAVTTGGTFTAKVTDARGRLVSASATESSGTATLTIDEGAWHDGTPGIGRIQIWRTNAGAKSVEVNEHLSILPGVDVNGDVGYG